MKKFFIAAACVILTLFCFPASACAEKENDNLGLFVFLSVRMKGNGDGTLTAVAKNEFALGSAPMPIKLTLYYSENHTESANMTEAETVSSAGLEIFETAEINYEIQSEGFYCAQISYFVNGEEKFLRSAVIGYDKQGNRTE